MNPAANPPHYPFKDDPFLWHPYAEILPMMPEEEIEELSSDIEQNGQLNPVQLYDGKILDGRNRYEALERLNQRRLADGNAPMPLTYGVFLKEVNPVNDARALAFVRSHNLTRRNLTISQRAAIAVQLKRHYEEIAKREIVWRQEKESRVNSHEDTKEALTPFERRSDYKAGKEEGVGQQTVSRADTIAKSNPALFRDVLDGKTTVNAAYNQIKPHKQKESDHPIEDESDSQTLEITSEEIIISFVSNIESLFPDEIQYCLNEIYNRRRDAVKEFIAKLKITDPLLLTNHERINQNNAFFP